MVRPPLFVIAPSQLTKAPAKHPHQESDIGDSSEELWYDFHDEPCTLCTLLNETRRRARDGCPAPTTGAALAQISTFPRTSPSVILDYALWLKGSITWALEIDD